MNNKGVKWYNWITLLRENTYFNNRIITNQIGSISLDFGFYFSG